MDSVLTEEQKNELLNQDIHSNDLYRKYAGKCYEMAKAACEKDPSLSLARGWYGGEQHWWCKREDGSIYDPSALQFLYPGIVENYKEFNGICHCDNCGKEYKEEDGRFDGRYTFCSYHCHGVFIGVIDD